MEAKDYPVVKLKLSLPKALGSFHSIKNRKALLSWCSACLAYIKPWVPSLALDELSVLTHACNPSIREVETEGPEVQGHTQL